MDMAKKSQERSWRGENGSWNHRGALSKINMMQSSKAKNLAQAQRRLSLCATRVTANSNMVAAIRMIILTIVRFPRIDPNEPE